MIKFTDVSVKKNDVTILKKINMHISEQRIGIIGRNGSGKSTFVRLLNGIETPSTGTVILDDSYEGEALRHHVGFVFQNPDNQIVYPIVSEDLAFGLKKLKLSPEETKNCIDEVLSRFGLEYLRDRLTHQLSGGEKQMIALAGVLVMRPEVIVFDEPTTLLDLKNKQKFMTAIEELDQQVIVVSHDLEFLKKFDRVIHIDDGLIVGDGDPASIIATYIANSQC